MADNIYVNLAMSNGSSTTSSEFNQQCVFNETRTMPIVHKASDYELSVVRFSLPTGAIPLMIAPMNSILNNHTTTTWTISITYTKAGVPHTFTLPVSYFPLDLTAPTPNTTYEATGQQDTTSKYYYVYSFAHIALMINATFSQLVYNILAYDATEVIAAPRIEWVPSTSKFRLYVPPQLVQAAGQFPVSTGTAITFNTSLSQVLANMPTARIGFDSYMLQTQLNASGSNAIVMNSVTGWIAVDQEVANTQAINSFQSIVITTAMIPVRAEVISKPPAFGIAAFGTQGNNASLQVLSDFLPSTTIGYEGQAQSYVEYIPSGEYRMSDLLGTNSISTLDLACWWTDRSGTLRPLNMPPNTSASIKLLLRRKGTQSFPIA